MLSERLKDFNTSNVTIQLDVSGHFYKGVIISIHLMLLFNLRTAGYAAEDSYFNTSNVTIQLENLIVLLFQSSFQYI